MQKDAYVDFLLGTDLQPSLGFCLVQVEPSGKTSDLLDSPNRTNGVKGRVNMPPEKLSSSGCAPLEPEAKMGLVDTQPSGDETEAVSHFASCRQFGCPVGTASP